MAKMLSVTIPEEQAVFISENEISPSKILQAKIEEIRETSKISQGFITELQRKISFLSATIEKQRVFIEENDLMDKFLGL